MGALQWARQQDTPKSGSLNAKQTAQRAELGMTEPPLEPEPVMGSAPVEVEEEPEEPEELEEIFDEVPEELEETERELF